MFSVRCTTHTHAHTHRNLGFLPSTAKSKGPLPSTASLRMFCRLDAFYPEDESAAADAALTSLRLLFVCVLFLILDILCTLGRRNSSSGGGPASCVLCACIRAAGGSHPRQCALPAPQRGLGQGGDVGVQAPALRGALSVCPHRIYLFVMIVLIGIDLRVCD